MKIEKSEIAPSGNIRLACYLGEEELTIMLALLQNSLMHTPRTDETDKTIERMRAMARNIISYQKNGLKKK